MVPILKKPTIDPSNPSNYRPITVSSIFQYGFRNNYSVGHGVSFLNDLMLYSRHTQYNMFICSMDAEKCFDSLWHAGLFYKLIDVLPDVHWCVLYNWYSNMTAVIKWNGNIHNMYFNVTRGTRQDSILSPVLFNICISDLMHQLNQTTYGIRVGDQMYNCFAYADDVSLFSSTVPGLQGLIDICSVYANKWRFKFGIVKSQCMSTGYRPMY